MRLPAISTQRKLGSTGLEAAGLGFGCFGLSNAYGPADPAEAVATLHRALDLGCSLLDTADIYGAGQNEILVGQALRGRRAEAVAATKFGFVCDATGKVVRRDASPAYVREAVEGSLKRLGIERIDLYTLHRVDPQVPIEDTVGAMAELVAEGKIRGVGLSEVSVEQLRRAHALHPIAAVQSEYSLWCREPEREILPACRELGVSFVAFAPLGRGFFSGALATNELAQQDFRRSLPRFQAESLARNEKFLQSLAELASRKQITLSQLALSWILAKGNSIFAIPGTRRQRHLEENVAAMQVEWTLEELEEIDRISAMHQDPGARYAPGSLFAPE
ncbi:aldo/keto reductase [Granulicella mallensis]|uniref:Pyridoxine 4-dehydrogenase n=1 Tax=Granulicella mallensis (strain ATCC BAA-1857 / DSM 23137 / MP5ACTX8) TaxID=682795 RepID=G8NXN8_GRAMM|nr:aldo/keto reductase [Granulicella mallensis]AEU39033.1 Pyridoxine 4-dehydrogenase [Granulicella mallensis MP5ACTX8]